MSNAPGYPLAMKTIPPGAKCSRDPAIKNHPTKCQMLQEHDVETKLLGTSGAGAKEEAGYLKRLMGKIQREEQASAKCEVHYVMQTDWKCMG
eukprot:391106-Pelagomonas_calceolata.AAC.5